MRRIHSWLLAGILLVVLGLGTVRLLTAGGNGVAVATVLALTVALLALAVQVFGVPWRTRPLDDSILAATAEELAREVRKRESAAQNKFLADSGDGKAANIGFAPTEQVSWPRDLVVWRSDSTGESGSLDDIADFYGGSDVYSGMRHGRLVVLGEAGAGKTVLANQLLLDLIRDRKTGSAARQKVPLRVSLSTFYLGADDDISNADDIAASLDAWIARYLVDAFAIPASVAMALVDRGWVLPILDGLDEMDPDPGDAYRAASVVRALNCPAGEGLRQVVLTCRTESYKKLASAVTEPGAEVVLQDATAVELEPLNPDQVAAYLAVRFPDNAEDAQVQQRWRPLIDHLKCQPDSQLSIALGSPLRLFLAVTSYHQRDTRPAELIRLQSDDLDDYLFDRFIPAVTIQHSGPRGHYNSQDVVRWLTTLAGHLEAQQRLYGRSGNDLDLDMLWTAAGYRAPRYLASVLRCVFIGIPLLVIALLYTHKAGHLFPSGLIDRIAVGYAISLALFSILESGIAPLKLRRLDFSPSALS